MVGAFELQVMLVILGVDLVRWVMFRCFRYVSVGEHWQHL